MRCHKVAIGLFLAVLTIFCSCQSKEVRSAYPNIIIILADDLGYGDLASYGSSKKDTPHLDRMAQGGLRFTDFHSNGAVCSPTRAALLSGRYQQKVGIEAVVHATKFRHTGLNPGGQPPDLQQSRRAIPARSFASDRNQEPRPDHTRLRAHNAWKHHPASAKPCRVPDWNW